MKSLQYNPRHYENPLTVGDILKVRKNAKKECALLCKLLGDIPDNIILFTEDLVEDKPSYRALCNELQELIAMRKDSGELNIQPVSYKGVKLALEDSNRVYLTEQDWELLKNKL